MDRLSRALPPMPRATRRRADHPAGSAYLSLASIAARIPTNVFLDEPLVAALVAEDAAWLCAVAAWVERRPAKLRWCARARWRAEGRDLERKRQRLCVGAAELGLPTPVARVLAPR